jgi:LacI family transcriptional regulator
MSDGRRATRVDVARFAGVSPAVVSYVLNGGPRSVAAATRERVLHAIEVLGYRPDPIARALRTQSTGIIGLMIPDITNPLFAELSDRIEAEAEAHGLAVVLATSRGSAAIEKKQLRNLVDRRVDGLVLLSARPDPDLTDIHGTRIVVVDRTEGIEGVDSIGVDFAGAARLGVEHLIGHGHRRIGFIGGSDGSPTTLARERGWLDALAAHGLPEGPSVRIDYTRDGGHAAARRLMALPERPSALFVASDLHAIGAMHYLNEADIPVPGEIAVVDFDGTTEAAFTWPPLTTVQQPIEEFARAALDALTSPSESHVPSHVVLEPRLVVRRSCGCDDSADATN